MWKLQALRNVEIVGPYIKVNLKYLALRFYDKHYMFKTAPFQSVGGSKTHRDFSYMSYTQIAFWNRELPTHLQEHYFLW